MEIAASGLARGLRFWLDIYPCGHVVCKHIPIERREGWYWPHVGSGYGPLCPDCVAARGN